MLRAMRFVVLASAVVCLLAAQVHADKIYGSIKYKSGSKAGNEVGVSTSWNSKKAYPKNGRYELDFGGKVGKKISVYVKGSKVGSVVVSGDTRFDIVIR